MTTISMYKIKNIIYFQFEIAFETTVRDICRGSGI